ncbi:MAG: phage tail protein [Anaerolinea sp.]|nr:phage tail protein [Anaerolinea sp.]MCC6974722.1 phage tail protein [Anaerolineae bacterium]
MSNPYIGEIRMFGGNFAPAGWAFCNGATLSISENDALFTLIGTTYGGDGQTTFNLPDLQGRVPVHQGNSFVLGQIGGTESVTLTPTQMPAHNHIAQGATGNTDVNPTGRAPSSLLQMYLPFDPSVVGNMNPTSVVGGSQPHENRQPYLAISFIISLFGIFPTQS